MEPLSVDNRISILGKLLEIQMGQMEQKAVVERTLFQWTTSLLLAVFGVIIALADKTATLPSAAAIKTLSTLIVSAPAILSVIWIFRRSRISVGNAKAIEEIQDLLGLFDSNMYGAHSPYPMEWKGKLAYGHARRKTPYYYAAVILIMSTCVVLAIWLVL